MGKGEFRLHSILRWLVPDQDVAYQGRTTRPSDTLWIVTEETGLSLAGPIPRATYVRILGPERLHMTCDDIPGGADILLDGRGFKFTPYRFRSSFGGGHVTVRCIDEAQLDAHGVLHDKIKMSFAGIHMATLTMAITIDRSPSVDPTSAG